MAARIIFLNGTPSAGKSTTARALQQRLAEPHFYLGLDEFRRGYLDRVWLADHGDLFQRTVRGYLPMLAGMVRAGHPVIAEAMLAPHNEALYLDLFEGLPVIFVGLTCDLAVAQAREDVRDDRRKGPMDLDQPELRDLHDHDCYDLVVDTALNTPDQVVDLILPVLDDPPQPSAFERLRARPPVPHRPA